MFYLFIIFKVRQFRANDKDAQKKYEECQKIIKRIAFEKAIACNHATTSVADSINLDNFGKHLKIIYYNLIF